ncbi:MAG: hypothetical protein KJ726_06640, partial [Verrucomicrobia bacterium]|nr:hypothetical protein [Verrucomicrobiota bacterium]MBU1909704.1 hypothetical protein [Verrucomicrobiota bacterium]
MIASPAQATAGSISNFFAFSWRNSNGGKFNAGSQCTLFIPAGWTAPQNTNASHPGYVSVAPVGNASAAINSIAGSTSWTVTVDFTANQSDNHGFNLDYAGNDTRVTAPTTPGPYTFVTQTRQSGGTLTAIAASPTITVTKVVAGITLHNLSQTYDGTPRVVTATTEPPGLTVDITYDGSPEAPINAGVYAVTGTVNDAMYQGEATGVLVIEQAGGSRLETFNNFTYTGSTYASGTFLGQDGSTWAYARARGDLSITGRSPTLEKAKGAYIRSGTIPGGVAALELKYRKAATQPLNCAIHVNGTRVGAITGGNGTVLTWTSGVLNIQGEVVLLFSNNVNSGAITLDDISWIGHSFAPLPAEVTLHDLSQTYDGTPRGVTATTDPPGLAVDLTYDGSTNPPINAGNYAVVGTVNDSNYVGSASDILVVNKADQTITFPNPGPQETTNRVGLSATASSGQGVSFAVVS